MKKYFIAGMFAITCIAFSYNTFVWAQAEQKKALTHEEADKALKKQE